MELLQAEEVACHHCGDSCDHSIQSNELNFCCYGCKAVYELLSDSRLDTFYSETSIENKSLSEIKAERRYGFLQNEDIQHQLLKFHSEELSVIKFFLPGIHCSSCIYLLEHLPKLDRSILKSEVNFIRKEVTISFRHQKKSLKEIAVLLSQLGYPPDVSLSSLDKTKNQTVKSNIGIKIAVAGFCFGNTMLMSMPEYLDTNFQLTEDFRDLFGWINLALTLPVLFYSGWDYFVKAWKGIRFRSLNIDVPIALGITTLFARTAFEIINHSGPGYADSLTGLVFFLLIGKWYQGKSYQALSFDRDYTSYFPVSITTRIGDEEVQRPLKDLQKNDLVVIHNDELIPADGIIMTGTANIDYSFVTGESIPERKELGQLVYAGGRQKGTELLVKLDKRVDNSELTQLWNSDVFTNKGQNLSNRIDSISQYFTLAIIIIALGTGVYWWMANPAMIWNSVTAILIVACPCALALTLPFTYGHAMRVLGRNGLYLRNAEVIESLSKVQSIIFDKTGTLTENKAEVSFQGKQLSPKQVRILKSGVGNSSHPLSRLIHSQLPTVEKLPITTFKEEPGKGFYAEINDSMIKVGSAAFLEIAEHAEINRSRVHLYINEYLGFFEIQSSYRKGIFEMLKNLRDRFSLSLLSGDNESEKRKLSPYFSRLLFNQKPSDKLKFLSSEATATLMIGDGLNDAGALKQANVGIAISEDIHQFSPSCDAIMQANNLIKMPSVLHFSKQIRMIVFAAFGISFLYNTVGLSFAVTGHLTPLISAILMPISSVTVVGFVTIMVGLISKKLKPTG